MATCYKILLQLYPVLSFICIPSRQHEFSNLLGRAQSRPFQSPPQSSHQSRGTFNHPADVRPSSSPSSGFTLPQLSANVVIILIAQYLSTLPENATICKDEIHQLIQNSKELFWQTHQENSTIQPFFLTIGKHSSLLLKYHTIQSQKIPYLKGPYNKTPYLTTA